VATAASELRSTAADLRNDDCAAAGAGEAATRSLYVQDDMTEACEYPTLAGFILGTMAGRVGEVLRSRYSRTAFASAMMIGSLVLNRSSSGIVCEQF
jgi:hypothetical protein